MLLQSLHREFLFQTYQRNENIRSLLYIQAQEPRRKNIDSNSARREVCFGKERQHLLVETFAISSKLNFTKGWLAPSYYMYRQRAGAALIINDSLCCRTVYLTRAPTPKEGALCFGCISRYLSHIKLNY